VKEHVVKAEPTKAFFVHTITRDIKIEDCILDLVDNSLDGARNLLGSPVASLGSRVDFSKFEITINFSEGGFEILDNCGGITLDDAINYAFTFGRRTDDTPDAYSIGIYGIGMKRAVFKLGNDITIRSTRPEQKKKSREEPFAVVIDVEKWLGSTAWDFDLESAEALDEPGVKIEVNDLNTEIAATFADPTFETSLRELLGRDYSRFISHGLIIRVNGKLVRAFEFNILQSNKIKPYRATFTLKNVKVEIISGMAAPPSESADPDEEFKKEDRSGWYVLCNDRLVLAADKSIATGWGFNGKQRWHPQYRGFMGIIMFSAESADDLPLTTTKRNVDPDRQIYKAALAKMFGLTGDWIEYTNRRRASLEEAKHFERAATFTSAFSLPANRSIEYPQLTSVPRVREITIQYPRLQRHVKALAKAMGDPGLSAREVGIRSFDYAYGELVEGGK